MDSHAKLLCQCEENLPHGFTPYLEAAENLTVSAANLALETSRPVVDRFGNTVNTYANKGLDTLESKVPIITKEPEEMLEITKSKATNMISSRVDGALGVTEQYVEYFLPRDDDGLLDEDADNDSSTEEDEVEIDPETKQPTERIREISNKVRQRSYKKAMKKLSGIQTRSKEALNKLSFTVDLIQYAQSSLNSTSAGIMDSANRANITVQNGVNTAKSNLQSVTSTINKQVEENVLQRAILLSRQLSDTCSLVESGILKTSPQLQPLLKKATQVKESTDELYQMFANKTSLSQLPVAVLASARPKLLFVETSLLQILEKISDQPPIAWLLKSHQEEQTTSKDEICEEN
uniref:Perilipin n=1 Tax=Ciona savignyi TaxID=51511 RepID=H2Y7W3_CIOSA